MLKGGMTGLEAFGIACVISVATSIILVVVMRFSTGKWIFGKNGKKTPSAKKHYEQFGK